MESPSKVTTTVMLAPALRERLDDEAARLDRSRSWVVAKAVEQFLTQFNNSAGAVSAVPDRPRTGEASSAPHAARSANPAAADVLVSDPGANAAAVFPDPVAGVRQFQQAAATRQLATKRRNSA